MINNNYLKLLRSRNRSINSNFINDITCKRITDSLDLIKIPFNEILEIGVNSNLIKEYVYLKFQESNYTRSDIIYTKNISDEKSNFLIIDLENLKLKADFYDLIISNFFIHLSSDFEKLFYNLHCGLKSNGLIVASIPDIDNIYQLVNSMFATDLLMYNGAYQRINPTKQIDDILKVLKKLNFHIPTINTDSVKIEYTNFHRLLKDLQSTNSSYCYKDKKKQFEKKDYFNKLEEIYKEKYYDNGFILNLKFNIISAWKK